METCESLLLALFSVVLGGILTWVIGKAELTYLLRRLKDAVMNREYVSLNEELVLTKMLSDKIRRSGYKPDVIFAVNPGGGMVAEWLSRRFLGSDTAPIPVGSLCIVIERDAPGAGTKAKRAKVDQKSTLNPKSLPKDSKVLLVNDVSRGGYTLDVAYSFLKKFFPDQNIQSATLFCSEEAGVKPTYCVVETKRTIRFEWKEPSPRILPSDV